MLVRQREEQCRVVTCDGVNDATDVHCGAAAAGCGAGLLLTVGVVCMERCALL